MMTKIYTDGACAKNPGGRGGWAAIIVTNEGERVISGSDPCTTNNRMELLGAISALEATEGPVDIISDSKYLINGASLWVQGWKRKGWRTKDGGPVKNEDLWRRIDAHSHRSLQWIWVRGHDGHSYNERCDTLAAREAGLDPTHRSRWDRSRFSPRLVRK